jgi:hypothetical protein
MDWSDEHRYDVLTANPDVKRRIHEAGASAHAPMSHEEWLTRNMPLAMAGNVRAAKAGLFGTELGYRIGLKLHLGVTRKRQAEGAWPVGEAIVAVLCSMAGNSQEIKAVQQRDDGCEITAEVPSDWRQRAGRLYVSVGRAPGGTLIAARAENRGALLDSRKAYRTLLTLFADVDRLTASWGSIVGPS